MSYTAPTAGDLQKRFPRFKSVDADVLTDALGRAARRADDRWVEADRFDAVMLYAAHELTMDGHGEGTEAQAFADGTAGFQSISSGSLSVTRFAKDTGNSQLEQTSYGKRYLELLRLNVGSSIRVGS